MKNTMISVIMSCYNETYEELRKCISSILNQKYSNFEFIIINDNPRNTAISNILNEIKDERITIIENEKNMGLVYCLNEGLKKAKGEYIARIDADDIAIPERLEEQLNYINKHSCDLIASNYYYEKNGIIKNTKYNCSSKKIAFLLKNGINVMPHPTWFGKKAIFDELFGYRDIFSCEDYDFLLRAINAGYNFGVMQKPLIYRSVRETSVSNSNKEVQFLTKYFLSKNYKLINSISINKINMFCEKELNKFKKYCRSKGIFNKYTYVCLYMKILAKLYT